MVAGGVVMARTGAVKVEEVMAVGMVGAGQVKERKEVAETGEVARGAVARAAVTVAGERVVVVDWLEG